MLLTECKRLNKFPDMVKSCEHFVNDSGQLLVDLVLHDLTPEEICKLGGVFRVIFYTLSKIVGRLIY